MIEKIRVQKLYIILDKRKYLFILLLFVFIVVQSVLSLRQKSPTFDEVGHLPAGYSYLMTNDYRLYKNNPPFIKQLAALPLLFLIYSSILDSRLLTFV